MGFNVFVRTHGGKTQIDSGIAAICKNGQVRLAAADATKIGLGKAATVLIDSETFRVAIRASMDDDPPLACTCVSWTKTRSTCRVSLGGALKSIGVDPARLVGRHPLDVKEKMLVLNLMNVAGKKR